MRQRREGGTQLPSRTASQVAGVGNLTPQTLIEHYTQRLVSQLYALTVCSRRVEVIADQISGPTSIAEKATVSETLPPSLHGVISTLENTLEVLSAMIGRLDNR